MVRISGLAFLASALTLANAQTFSECNPTQKTCPANPAIGATLDTDFTKVKAAPSGWQTVNAGTVTYDSAGANIIVAKKGDNPVLETTGYFLFGSLEVKARAAPGTGIVTSIVLLSDDLDEVDWELLGGNTAQVQSNYFGKGDTTTYDRAAWHAVSNPQSTVITYTVTWTPELIQWIINGQVVRSLSYAAASGGTRFPQTPMKVRIGTWAGGDDSNSQGTIEWAGGKTDYTKAPFAMTVQSVKIVNSSPGKSYTWSDTSGSYKSIKVDGGSVNDKALASSVASSATSSATTSLSIASAAPSANPLASAVLSNSTLISVTPTPSRTSSASATSTALTGEAAHFSKASMGGLTAVLALAMALFA